MKMNGLSVFYPGKNTLQAERRADAKALWLGYAYCIPEDLTSHVRKREAGNEVRIKKVRGKCCTSSKVIHSRELGF